MASHRHLIRSLVFALALAAAPAVVTAQAPGNRPDRKTEQAKPDRPSPPSKSNADQNRGGSRAPDKQLAPDRNRQPTRSSGEPELRRRKP